ncbi:MAG: stage 0 sporulation family protein [Candidatus Aureabacteria bacterium]|nr:stage 0 sporulation family protein [Candidatus Auribacterota bacterium]
MFRIIEVRMREAGRVHFYNCGGESYPVGECVIVEADRGEDYGLVMAEPETIPDGQVEQPLKKVIRGLTPDDKARITENRRDAAAAMEVCGAKIVERKLPMKLIQVEYSFDRSKIIFYFTAEGRVDFRELVRDLAVRFKARIELRQIGVRDEARMLGGIGCCGRQLCCATFLKEFNAVNIRMAKEQRLPLNPTKISGLCGRLLCCLRYEYEVYREIQRTMPKEGTTVLTARGEGRVKDINILKKRVSVELENGNVIQVDAKDLRRPQEKKPNT